MCIDIHALVCYSSSLKTVRITQKRILISIFAPSKGRIAKKMSLDYNLVGLFIMQTSLRILM